MGKCEPLSSLVFLAGKLRFFRWCCRWGEAGRKGGLPFWSADWSSGVLVDVVLGMVGQYGSPGLGYP